jgi:hypothetical protein
MSPPVPGSNGAENQAERRLDDILPGLPCLSSRPLAAQHGSGGQGHAGHLSYMPRLECVCLFAHTKQAFYTFWLLNMFLEARVTRDTWPTYPGWCVSVFVRVYTEQDL